MKETKPLANEQAPASGGLREFLDKSAAYARLPRVAHTPSFDLEPFTPAEHARGTEWFYIRDGGERIGLIENWKKEIEMFRFLPAGRGKAPPVEIPEVYHWGNLFGARIQLFGTQMLPPVKSFAIAFTKDHGDSLEFRVVHSHHGGLEGNGEYRLAWDERLGYVWTCESRYTMPQPARIEFNNLYAGGVSESREERKRWQKTVRSLADGRISFVHHNPLNIPTDDIRPGGFVGFVTEEDMNPFVELLETSEPVFMITCSQWYDQHILMKPPHARNCDGLYHARARYRFLSLPAAAARELENTAQPPVPDRRRNVVGFLLNQLNDFEQFVPRDGVYNGGVWQHATLSDEQAHSGRHSLKITGAVPGKLVKAAPIAMGPGVVGESGKRYRLTAWMKTDLTEGAAFVRVDDVRWNWDDIKATRQSAGLSGRTDWTMVSFEFQPGPNDPFLVLRLCVDGAGAAWFDDVTLEKVG